MGFSPATSQEYVLRNITDYFPGIVAAYNTLLALRSCFGFPRHQQGKGKKYGFVKRTMPSRRQQGIRIVWTIGHGENPTSTIDGR